MRAREAARTIPRRELRGLRRALSLSLVWIVKENRRGRVACCASSGSRTDARTACPCVRAAAARARAVGRLLPARVGALRGWCCPVWCPRGWCACVGARGVGACVVPVRGARAWVPVRGCPCVGTRAVGARAWVPAPWVPVRGCPCVGARAWVPAPLVRVRGCPRRGCPCVGARAWVPVRGCPCVGARAWWSPCAPGLPQVGALARRAQRADDVKALGIGQGELGDDRVGLNFRDRVERGACRGDDRHIPAARTELRRELACFGGVIVQQQQFLHAPLASGCVPRNQCSACSKAARAASMIASGPCFQDWVSRTAPSCCQRAAAMPS